MRLLVCLCVGLIVGGCAGRRVPVPAAAARTAAPATASSPADGASAEPFTPQAAAPAPSLASFIAQFRELSAQARPARPTIPTIESTDDRLREALAVQLAAPTAAHMRAVAAEYRRLNVFDRAYAWLSRALAVDPTDPATYDALARLWRDGGSPHLGLADAHRAVFFAPDSPEARNTLGTVLQALGHRAQARKEYERALALDPFAAYALNNLCYSSLLDGAAAKAVALCNRALDAAPQLAAARNNLALAYESQGDRAAAQRELAAAGDAAEALYNTGIIHLAQREYRSAVTAFQQAHALKPTLTRALARARQAAIAASRTEE